jgi:competence protein ComGC
MIITFLDGLLIVIIINLLLLLTYQNLEEKCKYNNDNICKSFNELIDRKVNTSNNNLFQDNQQILYNESPIDGNIDYMHNKYRLQENKKGPIIHFHQVFKKYMPELGWRNFYLKLNGGIDGIKTLNPKTETEYNDLPFNNIITKKYLDNLESNKNIYSNVNY